MKRFPLVVDGNAASIFGHVEFTHPVAHENMARYADQMMIVPIFKRSAQGNELVAYSVQIRPDAHYGWRK